MYDPQPYAGQPLRPRAGEQSFQSGKSGTAGSTNWNRTRPRRALVQNQQTKELLSARKKSHKHNNKDLSRPR